MILVETTGDGAVYVQDSDSLAQIIVEVGIGQMSSSEFATLLASKENALGNPSNENDYLRSTVAGIRFWDPGYVHPAYSIINLPSESGKAIKSLQVDDEGHVTNATIGTVESQPPVLEIANGATEDLSIGDKTDLQAAIVNYCGASGSVPQLGDVFFIVKVGSVSFLPSKKGVISGVVLSKYEDGDDLYLRIVNNSGDILYFEYSITTYDKQP